MGILSVLAAAVAAYVFGTIWYMSLAKPWMAATGVAVGEDGRPENASNPIPYIVAFVMAILVAGMMRHIFTMAGIDGVGKSLITGLGLGLFVAAPWIVNNVMFSGKPKKLALIDGGYAAGGCAVAGLVLGLF
ncbi:DUF1761 domain-containing protein [Aliiroseovarius lamellibrachiae]|uniref:DUF1761 domain-containing protein n=1 Tax=Aliiroseovarius lamellibrachiae TaxID=1924933 RepID=UPI001BDF7448|nr:DUF1761 domain-containing protein [Aliiroseovarius lamellibrachiae]MBT2131881.1 DUF1761 family protein [Aliiroseovarius lamellibrachiae]